MRAAPLNHPVPHVLIVDDDADLRREMANYLVEHGFIVDVAKDAQAMDQAMRTRSVDVLVLDVMMPGEDGLSVCQRMVRADGPAVIMLSAMGEDVDRIVGLELGADDYLPKPCNPRELLARVRAVLRRREDTPPGRAGAGMSIAFAGFRLDVARRQLRGPNDVLILLTGGEFSLLSAFLASPHRVLSRDQLLDMARGDNAEVFDRAIDVQVSRLRRKLHGHADREIIRTFRGVGYMFDATVTRL